MLVRLIYASRASAPMEPAMLDDILETAPCAEPAPRHHRRALPRQRGVPAGARRRPRGRSRLYRSIGRDKRHHDVVLLHYEEIAERAFARLVDGPGQCEQDQRRHAAALLGPGRTGPVPGARRKVVAGAAEGVDGRRSHRRPRAGTRAAHVLASVRPVAVRHAGVPDHAQRAPSDRACPNRPHSRSLSNSSTQALPGLAS